MSNPEVEDDEQTEQTISFYFVLFSFILAVVLVLSKVLHDHPRVAKIFPEAGMILLTGVLFGAIVELFARNNDESSSSSSSNNSQQSGAANDDDAVQPEEEEESVATSLLSFSPEVFFLVLLPPIIFNSGYHLRKELFFRHFTPICLFAVVGTTVSAFVIAGVLQVVCQHLPFGDDFQPTFTELLTFGGLLSATDPVTTLAVFQEKRVDPQLFYLVFGESVLNDAVGLVLFNAFKDFVAKTNDAGKVAVDVSEFVTGFLYDSVASPALGLLLGLITAWLFKVVDMRSSHLLELSLFVLIMYVPFLVAEMLDCSGIVTILFSGLAAQAYVVPNLSSSTVENAEVLFRLASHLAETAIFLELGLSVFGLTGSIQPEFIMWTILACLVGRACNVYPITILFNRHLRRTGGDDLLPQASTDFGDNTISAARETSRPARDGEIDGDSLDRPPAIELTSLPPKTSSSDEEENTKGRAQLGDEQQQEELGHDEIRRSDTGDSLFSDTPRQRLDLEIAPKTAHMLWFSGLRGAVAYACVRSFPDTFHHADEFTMATMIIVLASVFGLGSTTEFMLNKLQIDMNIDESAYMENWSRGVRRGGWIVQWEDYLYRTVVRGASHVSVPAGEHDGDENGMGGIRVSTPTSAHVEPSSVPRTPSTEYHTQVDGDETDHPAEVDLDPRQHHRRQKSVFDYGAKRKG
mmetsp:Transcript_14248/g.34130  ORF Transcript_14248/g.34130 Transcript_14248/m.34130 type:complete len:691 (-) Transcript_14248:755-2827(-)